MNIQYANFNFKSFMTLNVQDLDTNCLDNKNVYNSRFFYLKYLVCQKCLNMSSDNNFNISV